MVWRLLCDTERLEPFLLIYFQCLGTSTTTYINSTHHTCIAFIPDNTDDMSTTDMERYRRLPKVSTGPQYSINRKISFVQKGRTSPTWRRRLSLEYLVRTKQVSAPIHINMRLDRNHPIIGAAKMASTSPQILYNSNLSSAVLVNRNRSPISLRYSQISSKL